MGEFITLSLTSNGKVQLRADAITAVEVPDDMSFVIVRVAGIHTSYEVLPGQFSLDRLTNHTCRSGVRALV